MTPFALIIVVLGIDQLMPVVRVDAEANTKGSPLKKSFIRPAENFNSQLHNWERHALIME